MALPRKKPSFDPNKPFAWSYSKIKNFEVCPKRHFHTDILKEYADDSESLRYGNQVHDVLATAIGNKGNKYADLEGIDPPDMRPIPDDMKELREYVPRWTGYRNKGMLVATELQLAIREDFSPTGWFDKDAWHRSIVDVAAISDHGRGNVAICGDWKTGKVLEDSPQLFMAAMCIFAHFPSVRLVQTSFLWLKTDDETTERVRYEERLPRWNQLSGRVAALKAAYTNPDPSVGFPVKPNHFCRRYCPVTVCPFHGK